MRRLPVDGKLVFRLHGQDQLKAGDEAVVVSDGKELASVWCEIGGDGGASHSSPSLRGEVPGMWKQCREELWVEAYTIYITQHQNPPA